MIRVYNTTVWQYNQEKEITNVEIWTKDGVKYYRLEGQMLVYDNDKSMDAGGPVAHYKSVEEWETWGKVPFIPFKNNQIEMPDIKFVKSLIDGYDLGRSEAANYMDEVKNLIFVLKGYGGQNLSDFIKQLNEDRAILIDDTESLERTTIKRAKGRKSKYSASEKTVYLAENAKVDTLAHELFHEIDDAYGLIENGLLSKSVISDYNKLQNLAKGYGKSIKEMLYSRYPKAFEDNITDIKLKEAYRGISDVIHGMSNSDIFLGYGHKRAGYWDKEKALEKETFAQYGRTVFNGNEDAIKLFRELFPNSWKEISETMERMIK